jgi:hypothetical protein
MFRMPVAISVAHVEPSMAAGRYAAASTARLFNGNENMKGVMVLAQLSHSERADVLGPHHNRLSIANVDYR